MTSWPVHQAGLHLTRPRAQAQCKGEDLKAWLVAYLHLSEILPGCEGETRTRAEASAL